MSGFLLSILLLLAPAAADPGPVFTAAPTPAPSGYPFIGRTRSKRYCALETDRTNGAITVALTNDKIIAGGIGRLRSADLDKPDLTIIEREQTMRLLRAAAAAIQTNMRAGDAQVADLRALAIKEPDAARSPELKQFANKIDETLGTQRSIGADLAKMLTIIEGRNAGAQGGTLAATVVPPTQQSHVQNGLPSIDQRAAYEPLNQLFTEVADDFSDRVLQIGKSEDAAAFHAPKAVSGC
jgi:hypothetical protein